MRLLCVLYLVFTCYVSSQSIHEPTTDLNYDEKEDLLSFRTYFTLFRGKVPERLSDVTAEEILPLLPRNLSMYLPLIGELSTPRCQRHAQHFLTGLHNLTTWAVQSKCKLNF